MPIGPKSPSPSPGDGASSRSPAFAASVDELELEELRAELDARDACEIDLEACAESARSPRTIKERIDVAATRRETQSLVSMPQFLERRRSGSRSASLTSTRSARAQIRRGEFRHGCRSLRCPDYPCSTCRRLKSSFPTSCTITLEKCP